MVAARDLTVMPVVAMRLAPILVISDEDLVQEAVRRALCEFGYRVVSVRAESAARDLLEREPFGCVIVDVELPRHAGRHLLQRCRTSQPQAPVIAIGRRRSLRQALRSAGSVIAASLQKPFAAPSLGTLVEWVLDRRFRMAAALSQRTLRVVN